MRHQATELPAGTAVVVLVHPHPLAAPLASAVAQFLLGGGQVFAAVDPLSRFQKFQQGGMPFMMAPMALTAASDPMLLRGWGVNVDLDAVVGEDSGHIAMESVTGGDLAQHAKPDRRLPSADVLQIDDPWLQARPEAANRYGVKVLNRVS